MAVASGRQHRCRQDVAHVQSPCWAFRKRGICYRVLVMAVNLLDENANIFTSVLFGFLDQEYVRPPQTQQSSKRRTLCCILAIPVVRMSSSPVG
jgi:hypothetical protein